MRVSSTFVVSGLFLASDVTAGRRPRFEPLPTCKECVSRENIIAPGVGFDIGLSYGNAAIRKHDGSFTTVGKTEGSAEYVELMQRLSSPDAAPYCPQFPKSISDQWRCSVDSARRRLNKMRGLPSTPDVGIIAKLLDDLRIASDAHLGEDATRAILLVNPHLPGLSLPADLKDAAEYAGLTLLSTHRHIGWYTAEADAAFAGSGHGLCEHYNNLDKCEDEEADFPYSKVLWVTYSRAAFSAGFEVLQDANNGFSHHSTTRFDLGLSALPNAEEEQASFWAAIRYAIIQVGSHANGHLDTLLLMGDEAQHAAFLATVQSAIAELSPSTGRELSGVSLDSLDVVLKSGYDPLNVAAKGAAEFAKRAQEAPVGCRERPECAKKREQCDLLSASHQQPLGR